LITTFHQVVNYRRVTTLKNSYAHPITNEHTHRYAENKKTVFICIRSLVLWCTLIMKSWHTDMASTLNM